MKTKLTFLLSLTFLFLFSGSVYGDELQDGLDAYDRKDYKTAYKLLFPFAVQGQVKAQYYLGYMYAQGQGVMEKTILGAIAMWYFYQTPYLLSA